MAHAPLPNCSQQAHKLHGVDRHVLASHLQSAYHHFESLLENTGVFPARSLRDKVTRYDEGYSEFCRATNLIINTLDGKQFDCEALEQRMYAQPEHPEGEQEMKLAAESMFIQIKVYGNWFHINPCTCEVLNEP